MGDRHVVSGVNKQIFCIDANILYGWAMSHYLPSSYFENLTLVNNDYPLEPLVEDLLRIPDDNEEGCFIECDLKFHKIKSGNVLFCLYLVEANCELFTEYIKLVKQSKYNPTQKFVCDLTNKNL